jgi:hypothetical protein
MVENLCYRSAMWFGHEKLLATEEDMRDIIRIAEKIKSNVDTLRGWQG